MAFIKFIIISVGIYYLLKITLKALFPFLVKKTFDKMQEQAKQQQEQYQKQEGEVTIDKKPKSSNNPNKKDIGDYVDFEEVDE